MTALTFILNKFSKLNKLSYLTLSAIFFFITFGFVNFGLTSTRPALAQSVGCNVGGISTVAPGGAINVTYGGFAAGESVRLYGTSFQAEIGKTADSTASLITTSYQVPTSAPSGTYYILIVTRFPVTTTNCGGSFIVSGSASTCTFSPDTITAGGTINLTSTGASGEVYIQGAFASTPTDLGISLSSGASVSGTIPSTASGGLYAVRAGTTTCKSSSGGDLSVSGGAGGPCSKADVNGDGTIDITDQQLIAAQIGQPYDAKYDINGDGKVDSSDLTALNSCSTVPLPPPSGADLGPPTQFCGILTIVQNIIRILAPAAAIAFLIMTIIGGVKFLTSGGDPKNAASARSTLTYAIIGIILVVVAWLLLLLVQSLTGVDVTNVKCLT